jgi:DNA-binding transcriptional LysR family regulator
MAGLGEAAAGGIGLVLLPCYIGASVPGLAQLTPPLPDLESELWLITHPDLRNTARVDAFLDFCAEEIHNGDTGLLSHVGETAPRGNST